MTVMPDMTDSVDGYFTIGNISLYFTEYNQDVALAISACVLWHVS
jgi:hypothetical protein